MNEWMTRTAEFVLPGHPDKLADAIAEAIVAEARGRERRALVGVEVALHRDVVFIDGRVACQDAESIDFERIARDVYADVGYDKRFPPRPSDLRVITDLCLGPLLEGEAAFREVADDQSILTGYACSTPGTNHLPVEHALVRRLAGALERLRRAAKGLKLGPDGKLIVFVDESPDGRHFRLDGVSVSIQHAAKWDAVSARRAVEHLIRSEVERFALRVPGFDPDTSFDLKINRAGDFVEGGPHGDNGLSGKKLVTDFYGPRVPIGGGALFGKDFFKVDRAGPIIARKLAVAAVDRLGARECTVTLGIRPGDRAFKVLRAEIENRQPVDRERLTRLVDLTLASVDAEVGDLPVPNGVLGLGYANGVCGLDNECEADADLEVAALETTPSSAEAGSSGSGKRLPGVQSPPEFHSVDGNVYHLTYEPPLKWTLHRRTPPGRWHEAAVLGYDELRAWLREQTGLGNKRVRARLGLPRQQSIRGMLKNMNPPALLVDIGYTYFTWGGPGNSGCIESTREYWAQEDGLGTVTAFIREIPPIGWRPEDCQAARGFVIARYIPTIDKLEAAFASESAGMTLDRKEIRAAFPQLSDEAAA